MCRIDLEGTFQIAEPGDLGRPVIYLPPKHRLRDVGLRQHRRVVVVVHVETSTPPTGMSGCDSTGHAFLSFSPVSEGRTGLV